MHMVKLNLYGYKLQFNLLCDRHMKHSVTKISLVQKCVVQFNIEGFHCGNLYKEETV